MDDLNTIPNQNIIRRYCARIVHFYFAFLIKPTSLLEDEKRREYILNIFLSGSIIVILFLSVTMRAYELMQKENYGGLNPKVFILSGFLFMVLLFLSRKGYWKTASYLLLLIYFSLVSMCIYIWTLDVPISLLGYMLVITLAGIICGTRMALAATISSGVFLTVVTYLQSNSIIIADYSWKTEKLDPFDGISYSIMLGIIAIFSWLSNRELEKSLHRARTSETLLKIERNMLEEKIENRTRQLKEAQMEKMSQLYRFAEFGRLSSGLFHDLMNPLTSLSLHIQNINNIEEKDIPKKLKHHLDTAINVSHRMENFIKAIRKQINHQSHETYFLAHQQIEEAIELLSYKVRLHHINVVFKKDISISIFGNP